MKIQKKWLRDLASFVFSVYYLIAAEQADEKVRKVRAVLTVDHLRVSWNKSTTPYLSFFTRLMRPRLTRYGPRELRIPRPRQSSYKDPISACLYFDGPLSALRKHKNVVLDIPGGGFVAMDPRTTDDKLLAWAGKTGLPVLSLDYKKAPEHPYPYALDECYDAYHMLVVSKGRCIGMTGDVCPRILIAGDSAGGNLAVGLTLMVLQTSTSDAYRGQEMLPVPAGLVLLYPGLDMNIGNWMTDEQMSLIRDRRTRKTNKPILRRKSEDYYKLTPSTPHPSDNEDEESQAPDHDFFAERNPKFSEAPGTEEPQSAVSAHPHPSAAHIDRSNNLASQTSTAETAKPQQLRTRLAVSSMISYFNDRILTPEMMRAMIILYVGPHNRPDFSTDYLLSPLLAPEALLARFPKTYFMTGERDPLVDDTVIFAGRIRQAKLNRFLERKDLGLEKSQRDFDESDHVEVCLIPGISHGFAQFVSVFPEGWKLIFRCARWITDIFATEPAPFEGPALETSRRKGSIVSKSTTLEQRGRHHRRMPTAESSGDEDKPLEMSRIHASTPPRDGHVQGGGGGGSVKRGRGRGGSGRDAPSASKRSVSTVSLASEDDLLKRRMNGLTGGLMGMTNG